MAASITVRLRSGVFLHYLDAIPPVHPMKMIPNSAYISQANVLGMVLELNYLLFFNRFLGRWEVFLLWKFLIINIHEITHVNFKRKIMLETLHVCIFLIVFIVVSQILFNNLLMLHPSYSSWIRPWYHYRRIQLDPCICSTQANKLYIYGVVM